MFTMKEAGICERTVSTVFPWICIGHINILCTICIADYDFCKQWFSVSIIIIISQYKCQNHTHCIFSRYKHMIQRISLIHKMMIILGFTRIKPCICDRLTIYMTLINSPWSYIKPGPGDRLISDCKCPAQHWNRRMAWISADKHIRCARLYCKHFTAVHGFNGQILTGQGWLKNTSTFSCTGFVHTVSRWLLKNNRLRFSQVGYLDIIKISLLSCRDIKSNFIQSWKCIHIIISQRINLTRRYNLSAPGQRLLIRINTNPIHICIHAVSCDLQTYSMKIIFIFFCNYRSMGLTVVAANVKNSQRHILFVIFINTNSVNRTFCRHLFNVYIKSEIIFMFDSPVISPQYDSGLITAPGNHKWCFQRKNPTDIRADRMIRGSDPLRLIPCRFTRIHETRLEKLAFTDHTLILLIPHADIPVIAGTWF